MLDNDLLTNKSFRKRFLIVNADDFGLSSEVNKGIIEAHERGIVTSTSLMVRGKSADEAALYGQRQTNLSIGLHFDLYEWAYRNEEWFPIYEVVPTDDAEAVKAELLQQLEMFQKLVGRQPTHLDSHQHAHRSEPVRSVLLELGEKLKIPVRDFSNWVNFNGNFYGQTGKGEPYSQAISVNGLIEILKNLPPGITELGCHPGFDGELDTMYVQERSQEVAALCDPRIKLTLAEESIKLISFSDVSRCANPAAGSVL